MEKKVKILFINKYQDSVYRGAETFVSELSKRLLQKFQVDVMSKVNYLKILTNKYDIIIPTNGRGQVLVVRIISWLTGSKMVVSGQSGPGADDKWNLVCMPDVFVVLTDFQRNWANKFNLLVKVEKIPNGVDLNKFDPKVKPIKIDLPHPIVLSVGALEPGKRLDLIIKAVAKTSASLLIVGRGKLEKELIDLGNNLLKDRFKIMSFPFEDMPRVYPACDVFTYPTVPWESFGIVLVEAMASGLPVVATDDPIRSEIVGDGGMLVDPTDSDKYAQTLESVLNKNWGNLPCRQAEKFSWDKIAKGYEKLFLNLIK